MKSESELQQLTTKLEESAGAYGMEISAEKSKVLVNNDRTTLKTEIQMNGEILEEVDNFKYLGAIINKEGNSTQEIKTRLAIAIAAMTKLSKIWNSSVISTRTKIKLYKSLITSIALYGCESWTLTAEMERRIQAFETKCYRRILGISYKDRKTNEFVIDEIHKHAGKQEPLLTTVRSRKLKWFGHTTRHTSLAKSILQGTVTGGRKRGRPKKAWIDNIKEWTNLDVPSLLRQAEDRKKWRATCSAPSGTPTICSQIRGVR